MLFDNSRRRCQGRRARFFPEIADVLFSKSHSFVVISVCFETRFIFKSLTSNVFSIAVREIALVEGMEIDVLLPVRASVSLPGASLWPRLRSVIPRFPFS